VRLELYITAVAADKISVKLNNGKHEIYDFVGIFETGLVLECRRF
jgi:hypothetical protein